MDEVNNSSCDYVYKLYSLKILKQAFDMELITCKQFEEKQKEFLRSIDFSLEDPSSGEILLPPEGIFAVHDDQMLSPNVLDALKKNSARMPKQLKRKYEDDSNGNHDHVKALKPSTNTDGKHKTFSEFIYTALISLGGTADLQSLYRYVNDHQNDIDDKFAYRFKNGEYKSNVRSTLHNTGSFHKTVDGRWTINSPLKGRGGR